MGARSPAFVEFARRGELAKQPKKEEDGQEIRSGNEQQTWLRQIGADCSLQDWLPD